MRFFNREKRTYYWAQGNSPKDGKPVLVGPFGTESRANAFSDKLEDGRVFDLPTKNQAEATRIVKAKLAGESDKGGLGNIITRFSHKDEESEDGVSSNTV
jgi:hypothetical protein